MSLSIDLQQRIFFPAGPASHDLRALDSPPPFRDPLPEDSDDSLRAASRELRGTVEEVALLASAVIAELPRLIADAKDQGLHELEIGWAAVNPLRLDTNPSARLLESIALKLRDLYKLDWRQVPSTADGVVQQALYVIF